jgi:DNA polymerase-3 subunit delta
MQELGRKIYQPIYFLCGDEEYFIDQISDHIEEHVLDEAEKEFNQSVVYGRDIDLLDLESLVKRYPMMASYNVVIVKEAQFLKKWEQLLNYIEKPSDSSILVICHKHKKPDGRNKGIKALKKSAVYFESKKLYENQIAPWIEQRVIAKGYQIHPKASQLLIEFLGTDLSKISNELSKLMINLEPGGSIDSKLIEENIGISKDYNVFELNNALGARDVLKANRIIHHFGKNESAFPVPMILPSLYRFFSQLLLFKSLPAGNPKVAASKMGINPYFMKDYQMAARNYSQKKIARIMSSLRKADLRSKGVGVSKLPNHELLQELVYEILH